VGGRGASAPDRPVRSPMPNPPPSANSVAAAASGALTGGPLRRRAGALSCQDPPARAAQASPHQPPCSSSPGPARDSNPGTCRRSCDRPAGLSIALGSLVEHFAPGVMQLVE
jgi:hypothetical protein